MVFGENEFRIVIVLSLDLPRCYREVVWARVSFIWLVPGLEFAKSRWDSHSEPNWFHSGEEFPLIYLEIKVYASWRCFQSNMFFLVLQYSILLV